MGDRPGGGLLVDVVTVLAFVWLVINVEPILDTETADVPGNGDLSVVGIFDVIGAIDIESFERVTTSVANRCVGREWDDTLMVWTWLISVFEGEPLKVFKEMVSIVVESQTLSDDVIVGRSSVVENSVLLTEATEGKPIV